MIVTTKTGDQGTTEIQGGRISKADPLIEVLGDLDELSAECLVLASGFSGYRKSMKQIGNPAQRRQRDAERLWRSRSGAFYPDAGN